jgi:RNA polymerase sigma-70 factor, ECF subfamily
MHQDGDVGTLPLTTSPLRRETRTEARLLAAAQAGERKALESLLTPHAQTLRYVCLGILRNADDAEDAVQETYFRAVKGLSTFRGQAQLKTWLVRIAVNVCAERRRSRRDEVSLDELHAALPSPEGAVVKRILLDQALAILPPARRIAFLLLADGWSQREIGEAQGWSVARVKVELYRARRALDAWAARTHEEER